jgi:hypothetical protein
MKRHIPRMLFLSALYLTGLTALLYAVLALTTSWKQARSPGEKDFGVGLIAMMIGIPLLLSAVGGLGCLVLAGGMFAARRFRRFASRPPVP